jgi:hypothetical protein
MAAQIAVINVDLAAINAKRAVLWAPPVHLGRRQSAKNTKEAEQVLKVLDTEQAALSV